MQGMEMWNTRLHASEEPPTAEGGAESTVATTLLNQLDTSQAVE